jgi:hypothetical protein
MSARYVVMKHICNINILYFLKTTTSVFPLFIFYAFVGIVTTAPVYGVYISQIIFIHCVVKLVICIILVLHRRPDGLSNDVNIR